MGHTASHAYRTALVTGASRGIGASFAQLLAKAGTELVVVARDAQRLEDLAVRLRDKHKTVVEVLAADLTEPGGLSAVEARLTDPARPVELLVNNAGFGTTGRFAELDADREEREVRLNVLALMRLAHAALGGMLERGHGGILNVSSMAGFVPSPGGATYAATKAFVTSFSESLHAEVRRRGVHVTALCPGFTRTGSQAEAGYDAGHLPGFAWLASDDVAAAGLAAVAAGRALCVPGLQYKAAAQLTRFAPRTLIRSAAERFGT
ncbi:MAG: SDR family NAD(P)-dependent oxidoreductase [Micromonosporaceae bacterium]